MDTEQEKTLRSGEFEIRPLRKKKWKTIRSEYLFRRPWLTARLDQIELPDGRVIPEYYVLEYPDWVNVIAITRDGQFVMERQFRYAAQLDSIELPCGVAEPGEDALKAAQRELLEETGYGGGRWEKLMTIYANPGSLNNPTHCFLATDVEPIGSPKLDDTEELTVELMSRQQVYDLLTHDRLIQALMIAPLWKYFSRF